MSVFEKCVGFADAVIVGACRRRTLSLFGSRVEYSREKENNAVFRVRLEGERGKGVLSTARTKQC